MRRAAAFAALCLPLLIAVAPAEKPKQLKILFLGANHPTITAEQEKALLDYVASGKGFIPLHCASYCFIKSDPYVELVGAQFKSHSTGTFRTTITQADHPVMKGFGGFESFDETYVH